MSRCTSRSIPSASFCVAALACVLLSSAPVLAVSIPIDNHSFEAPDVGGTFAPGIPTGWTDGASLNSFLEDSASVGFTGGDGLQYFGFEGGMIYQDLGVPFQAGMTYQVNLASAHRDGYTHETVEFGVFSSDAIGTDLGTIGFMDIQGVWDGANPDGDNMFNLVRDASDLQLIGSGSLGRMSTFTVGQTAPTGNIVVFMRNAGSGLRVNVDNIRLEEISGIVAGDVTGDGDVNLDDYIVIRDNFRSDGVSRMLGDLSGDGTVDFVDFLEWRNNSPFAGLSFAELDSMLISAPEPSSLTVALLGLLAVSTRRQRD